MIAQFVLLAAAISSPAASSGKHACGVLVRGLQQVDTQVLCFYHHTQDPNDAEDAHAYTVFSLNRPPDILTVGRIIGGIVEVDKRVEGTQSVRLDMEFDDRILSASLSRLRQCFEIEDATERGECLLAALERRPKE